jgi:PPP family 3-phenylpropionic acid transporter
VALFLLGGVLMQASHGPYYVFFSLHLRQAGIPPRTLGLLWAAAIGAEILMMLRMPSILMRHGPVTIMAACSALAAVRWTLCALSVEPLLLLPAQVLHAATFAAFHIAAVSHAFSEFGRERSATGQAIFSSATYGLGSILGMVGSGLLRDPLGTPALFGCAAGVALAGGLLLASVARPRRGALP